MPGSSGGGGLPVGWEDRKNQMSERDIRLGGDAATKFASHSSSASAYGASGSGDAYLSSDQVRAFYMQKIDAEELAAKQGGGGGSGYTEGPSSASSSALPAGWEDRQRRNAADEKQHGVFSRGSQPPADADESTPRSTTGASSSTRKDYVEDEEAFGGAEAALVRVAAHSLDQLARTLERSRGGVQISPEDRAALAAAMKRAMDAVAGCR